MPFSVPDAPEVEAKQLFSSITSSVIYSMINTLVSCMDTTPFLKKLMHCQLLLILQSPINISDRGIDGSASSYTITYYSFFSGSICGTATIPVPSDFCINGICRHVFDSSSSVCDSVTDFVITAYATNVFGDGPTSNPVHVNIMDTQFSYFYNCCKYFHL